MLVCYITLKARSGLCKPVPHWWDIHKDGTNDYWVKSGGVMETYWQLQSSRTPPAPISLAGGRAPNASVYATWYLYWWGVAGGLKAGQICGWELMICYWLYDCQNALQDPFFASTGKKVYTVRHLTLTRDYLKNKRNTFNIRLYIYI